MTLTTNGAQHLILYTQLLQPKTILIRGPGHLFALISITSATLVDGLHPG